MAGRPRFGAWIHEAHHATKRDAPSGTALAIDAALKRAGYVRPVNIASTRAGSIPGTHTFGFDAAAETLTFTHEARDRSAFARGARSGALGHRPPRMVHDARRAGAVASAFRPIATSRLADGV